MTTNSKPELPEPFCNLWCYDDGYRESTIGEPVYTTRQMQDYAEAAAHALLKERDTLTKALKFYADRNHFMVSDYNAWDTASGEDQTFWCDENGTATIEDGDVARQALDTTQAEVDPHESIAWLRVIDEALVAHHVSAANISDNYEKAQNKLNSLLYAACMISQRAVDNALKKDAERYRWIARWNGRWSIVTDDKLPKYQDCDAAFDKAIDAAMVREMKK